jgi:DNA-binding MarR family transcriptional regulator
MSGQLATELRMRVGFATREMEAVLNLVRTTDRLRRETAELLRPHGLSPTGYNVLRILRGAGPAGLPCHAVSERLVTHDPDITRLADRLIEAGWLVRDRKPGDRRVVVLRITQAGIDVVGSLDAELTALHRAQLAHLGDAGLEQLIELCEQARHPPRPVVLPARHSVPSPTSTTTEPT